MAVKIGIETLKTPQNAPNNAISR